MRQLFITILTLFLFSCQSEKQKAEAAIRKSLTDNAFKLNKNIKIHEINVLDVQPATYSAVKEEQLNSIKKMIEAYDNLYKNNLESIKQYTESIEIFKETRDIEMADHSKEQLAKQTKWSKENLKEIEYYKNEFDSVLKVKVDDSRRDYYKIKALLKVTLEGTNTLDTFFYVTDKNMNILDASTQIIDPSTIIGNKLNQN